LTRTIETRYRDPLSEIWLATASRIGLDVQRTADAYASTDGAGTLFISSDAGMDPDDCLPQMIFHEVCHFLVCGPESLHWVDWGLDNETNQDEVFEHACLRLQAAWLRPYGLRRVLAPTTDFRSYYDTLPEDPFKATSPAELETIIRARAAYTRRHRRPLERHVETALAATASIARSVAELCEENALLGRIEPPVPLHPAGFPLAGAADSADEATTRATCGSCSWASLRGPGTRVLRCMQADSQRVDSQLPACERYESDIDCLTCGACCREAYDTVEVGARDPAKKKHLHLMVERTGGLDMKREGARCICLRGGRELRVLRPSITSPRPGAPAEPPPPRYSPEGEPFTCSIYEERPQTCRDFARGSDNCLHARRRVGLSL
jgi:Fe-S-cluster containining protein